MFSGLKGHKELAWGNAQEIRPLTLRPEGAAQDLLHPFKVLSLCTTFLGLPQADATGLDYDPATTAYRTTFAEPGLMRQIVTC